MTIYDNEASSIRKCWSMANIREVLIRVFQWRWVSMGNFPMTFETVFFDNWQVDPTAPGRTGSLKHDLPPDRLRQQQHSNSSHSNMWAQPNVNHVRNASLSANTKVQDSKCSDDFNLCFSSPGNQQLTRSSGNHHSTGSLKHDLPPGRLRQQQHSNSSHSNMWAQPNVNHVRNVSLSANTKVQDSKCSDDFNFVFLFTWQSATYQIIKKSSQHRVFETWPASRQAETTATQQQQSLKHVGSAECKSCQNCIEEQTHINALSANTKVQDSKCSDDFNLCFSSPGNQQLTRSSRNHHSTGSLKHDLPPDRLRQQQHSNSCHSNMWAQPNVNHVRIVLKSKRT